MTTELRHTAIVDLLKQQGKAKVEELAERLNVSEVTIRKDLTKLEEQGLLERVHGSAIISQRSRFNIAFLERLRLQAPAKTAIAQAAASYIQEEACILADSSKFGHECLVSFADLSDIHLIITDSEIPVEYAKEFKKRGVHYLIASEAAPQTGEI